MKLDDMYKVTGKVEQRYRAIYVTCPICKRETYCKRVVKYAEPQSGLAYCYNCHVDIRYQEQEFKEDEIINDKKNNISYVWSWALP
jgi:transcription elongation factor Elf1